ncbi:putative serine/threonine-protein kinase [Sesbania bispinosa]|nr:putative serine/threonine-protein kinase [Sesbania bispinosa]
MGVMSFMGIIFLAYLILVYHSQVSLAIDSISQSLTLRDDGNTTLVSKGGTFELGFFTPGNSQKRYLGIWYKKIPIQTVVWVANRVNPINDSSSTILRLNSSGSLVLSQNDTVVWSTTPLRKPESPIALLLDSGNLVVRDEKETNTEEAYLWQSFDYPTDTFLPEMKFGWDFRIGLNRNLTAWKSPDDPSPGDFSFGMVPHNYPDAYMMKGGKKFYRSGPWNGLHSSGSPQVRTNPIYDFRFVFNKDELYYTYSLKNSSVISRLVLNGTANVRRRYVWIESAQRWEIYTSVPLDLCDTYALCGAYANCIITDSPVCQCMEGFKPKSPQAWYSMDWSHGCVRNKPLSCKDKEKDGFMKLSGLKVPDTTHSWLDEKIGLEECRAKCLDNCSCMAYANADVNGKGSGCAMWFGDLIDIRQFASGGQDLYVRMDASELEHANDGHKKGVIVAVIVFLVVAAVSGILILGWCYKKKSRTNIKEKSEFSINRDHNSGMQVDDMDLPVFDLSTIAKATSNFTINNKIGEGGFGPVYRGILADGVEIAVKRLSTSSGQGLNEFKNEVKLIAKLQHRNLVKLLGCCLEGEEKMLVYEYMPNGSLDSFIFDQQRSELLDWSKRFHIICGIAKGLLYLHQDSRLRIIHRDLKASNVLLDNELNPKISDFGMARIFGGDQKEGNTKRIVGTYGYMAPEYATDGLFSVKSDVFSFGILLMEIISGKRSRGYYNQNHNQNLIGHAWKLWKEGRPLELIDKSLGDSCSLSQILHCIHISLLCVQQYPEDRPGMSCVLLMLVSEFELPEPKQPGFFGKDSSEADSSTSKQQLSSTNEITITLLEAR